METETLDTLDKYNTIPEESEFAAEDEVFEAWTPVIPKITPKQKSEMSGKREIANGRTLTIKSYGFTKVKTKDTEGNKIEPKLTLTSGAPYYPGKLIVHFVEDNLVEYYPNLKYFVRDNGKISKEVRINREGKNAVALIAQKVIELLPKEDEDISDSEIYNFLIGKKVVIKTESGNYNKKDWFRNDIAEFI